MQLIRQHYADFGPTLATEKLLERHGIPVSVETVRNWMISDGLWRPHSRRQVHIYQPRHRRDCLGELIQLDGSHHAWFEERAPKCCLLVYIDDADKVLYLLEDNELSRRFQGKYAEVWQYPNGTIELRANGTSLPFTTYDRLGDIDQGAIVDNKRLGAVLRLAQVHQDEREQDGKRERSKKMPKRRAQAKVQEQLKAINPVLVNPAEFRASLKR